MSNIESIMKRILTNCMLVFSVLCNNARAEGCNIEHSIQAGDTVFSLSRKYNIKIDEIYKCNPSLQNKPDVKLGQKIKVSKFSEDKKEEKPVEKVQNEEKKPEVKSETQKLQAVKAPAVVSPAVKEDAQKQPDKTKTTQTNPDYYVVSSGDTLYGIAKKHDIKVEDLKRANDLNDATIWIGQKIKIKKEFPESGKVVEKPVEPPKQIQPPEEQKSQQPLIQDKNKQQNTLQQDEYEVETIQPQNSKNDFFQSLVRPVKGKIGKKNVNGIYFYSNSTDNVHVVQSGTVLFSSILAKNKNFNNNYVVVVVHNFDGKKYLSSYGNLKKVYVQKGDKLVKNQVIGIVDGASEYKGQGKLFFTMMDKDGIVKSAKLPFE